MYDICIIGCGASGMAAALAASGTDKSIRICIIEKNEMPGRKLLATGNGRCNLSNEDCETKDEVLSFLSELGIVTRTDEEGRIYPYSEQGAQIVDVLKNAIFSNDNITCMFSEAVTEISRADHFTVRTGKGSEIEAEKLLISTGGKAAPEFGTTGDGFGWAKKLGHTVTRLAPALTAIECAGDFSKVKGVRAKAEIYLFRDGDMIAREYGELQFTKDGLSGICIFNVSSELRLEENETFEEGMKRYRLNIDLVPDIDEESLIALLKQKQESLREQGAPSGDAVLLETIINSRLAEFMCGDAESDAHDVAAKVKYWDVEVTGVKGWKNAQCTAGGVCLDEIDEETMESRIVPGLFFAGEVTDYDGPCGGFNLNNAWITGMRAGRKMASDKQGD